MISELHPNIYGEVCKSEEEWMRDMVTSCHRDVHFV